MFGILLGTSIVFLITALFNVLLSENMETAFTVIGVLGGTFILYLSFVMIKDIHKEDKVLIKGDKLFLVAILLNFINPKTIIFGVTVATYYINIGLNSDYIYFFAILMGVICFISVVVWGLLGDLFSDILKKHNIVFNIIMASLLAYSGVLVIIESVM